MINGKKMSMPLPRLCPEERQRRRLCLRNERKLYRRQCDFSGKNMISTYSPDKQYKVYQQDIWESDKRDGLARWMEFDFSKAFTEQFQALHTKIPVQWLISQYNENCDYTSICGYCKNCYLLTASENSEDCFYGHVIQTCKDVIDCCFAFDSERSYGCVDIKKCFNCFYAVNCYNSHDCYYTVNLENCDHCFLSNNLSNQSYMFENKQLSKEDYQEKVKDFLAHRPLSSEHLQRVMQEAYYKNLVGYRNEHAFGNTINDSKDVVLSVDVDKWENVRYCQIAVDGDNLMDCSNVYIANHLSYQVMSALSTNNNLFSGFIYNCDHVLLSYNCNSCSFLFGCSGLKNQKYCIFNTQYTPADYEKTVDRIIDHLHTTGERGEFFNSQIAFFGYNETVAQDYMPLTKEEAVNKGFKRSDYEEPFPQVATLLQASELPDIQHVKNDILQQAIVCEVTGKPFRVIQQELDFYRAHNIPLPKRHPEQRYTDRMWRRPGRWIYLRTCDSCGVKMLSGYKQEDPYTVYCEVCYTKKIYW